MTALAFAFLIGTVVPALLNWRYGLLTLLVMGVTQDPLRKLAAGRPVYYIGLVVSVFVAAWLRAYLSRVRLTPAAIVGWRRYLDRPFKLFLVLLAAQSLHSFLRFGSAYMTGVGLIVWLAPVGAVVLGYQFALRGGLPEIKRWMVLYCLLTLVALATVYLEYLEFDWPILGEVGEAMLIFDVGTVLKAHAGIYRGAESAAWHTAAVACFVFTLAMGRKPTLVRFLAALLVIVVLSSVGVLTGRRKLLMAITVFLSCYLFLYAWLQRGASRLAAAALVTGAIGYIVIVGFVAPDPTEKVGALAYLENVDSAKKFEGYAARGQTVFEDVPGRLASMGVAPLYWALNSEGWHGAGVGSGTQGANARAEQLGINGGAAEGGLGKIAMELGVPGLALMVWLVVAACRHLGYQLRVTARASLPHARVAYGLIGFIAANAAMFTVATQIFSDLFALLILGLSVGFVLALPALAHRAKLAREQTAAVAGADLDVSRLAGQPLRIAVRPYVPR